MAKLETCDGGAISISLPKGEVEPWELRFRILAGGLTSTSSCIFLHFNCSDRFDATDATDASYSKDGTYFEYVHVNQECQCTLFKGTGKVVQIEVVEFSIHEHWAK